MAKSPNETDTSRVLLGERLRAGPSPLPSGLVDLLEAVAETGRAISLKVRRARIEDVVGEAGATNIQGEAQQKLDVIANDLITTALVACPSVAVLASEEEEEATRVRSRDQGGEYAVLFDPLDGSSNIDVAVGIGTIFSVLPNTFSDTETLASALQPGSRQVASGYLLYGSQVALVLTTGEGVDLYVLDPESDEFVLVEAGLRVPQQKKIYSLNEAYVEDFPEGYQQYLAFAHGASYSGRYIGSMVADVHRTLLKGGVFIYPPTAQNPDGKLRLLYEANPMAHLMEQAGGRAITGEGRILEVEPAGIHQRIAVILGSPDEVDTVEQHLA